MKTPDEIAETRWRREHTRARNEIRRVAEAKLARATQGRDRYGRPLTALRIDSVPGHRTGRLLQGAHTGDGTGAASPVRFTQRRLP